MSSPRVHSHWRSGTHALMAAIWTNFAVPDCGRRVQSGGGTPTMAWYMTGKSEAFVPWAGLFGGHQLWAGGDSSAVVYCVRHPLDCLYSCWRAWGSPDTADEWITPARLRYWLDHAASYDGVGLWVRYEEQLARPVDVLQRIEARFGLVRRSESLQPVGAPVGWSPGEMRTGYAERLRPETIERAVRVLGPTPFGYKISGESD